MAPHPTKGTIETVVKVVSWNVWWRFGPWEERVPAISKTLASIDADIICLQEVWDDGEANFAANLAADLGYHFVYAPGAKPNGVFFGNAILSRWPIGEHEIISLYGQENAEEFRVAVYAEIDGPRGKIPVFCTHINWQFHHSHIRQKQVADVTRFVESQRPWKYPPILCGDFNADPQAEEIRMLSGQASCPTENLAFHDAWAFCHPGEFGFTWDNSNPYVAMDFEPNRRIDYIFAGWPRARGAGHVVSCKLAGIEAVDGVQPSDHYAVVAELRY